MKTFKSIMISVSIFLLLTVMHSCETPQDEFDPEGTNPVGTLDNDNFAVTDSIEDANSSMTADQNYEIKMVDYYVATEGNDNNPGTFDKPFATWQKAVDIAEPGDTIYIRGGTYRTTKNTGSIVDFTNLQGTAALMICIFAYPGEKPVLNMDNKILSGYTSGMHFYNTDYVYLKGLRITGMPQTNAGNFNYGMSMSGYCDNNIIEACEFDHVCLGFSMYNQNGNNTGNLILNCDAHHCDDPYSSDPHGAGDGFLNNWGTAGATNTFKGCRAWWCTDDGFDGFKNAGNIIYESCWSFRNGYVPGTYTVLGGGTGFKMGWSENPTQVNRIYQNCLAFDVAGIGFSSNDANSLLNVYNCTAYRNSTFGFRFTGNLASSVINCISFNNGTGFDFTRGDGNNSFIQNHNSWENSQFYAPGSWNDFITTANDFISMDTTGITGPRGPNGELPELDFLRLRTGSKLINAGENVGLKYLGTKPDLGAFEKQ